MSLPPFLSNYFPFNSLLFHCIQLVASSRVCISYVSREIALFLWFYPLPLSVSLQFVPSNYNQPFIIWFFLNLFDKLLQVATESLC